MLTYQEVELIQKALEYYEQEVLPRKVGEGILGLAFRTLVETGGDKAKAEQLAEEMIRQDKGKMQTQKEQVILLRAKLIGMKDKALVDSLDEDQ